MSRDIGHARSERFLERLAAVDDRRAQSNGSLVRGNLCYAANMNDLIRAGLKHARGRALSTDAESLDDDSRVLESVEDVGIKRRSKRGSSPIYVDHGEAGSSPQQIGPKKAAVKKAVRANRGRVKGEPAAETPTLGRTDSVLHGEIVDFPQYQPLGSVWNGEDDAELLEKLLRFYPRKRPRDILDATINGGRFWRNSKRKVVGLDIDPKHRPTVVADNTVMPFRDAAFDVVVYDPPHIPNQGRDQSKDFSRRFGLGERSAKEHGYTFTHTYPPFMREAYRVLRDEGVLLAKIADYVHNHRYQWAHIELIKAGRDVGFTACDCVVKVRKGPIIDPKWKVAHHTRRQHSYWIIFRKSHKCE